jgi:indolepyruvate ferredoxin oxidoreductase
MPDGSSVVRADYRLDDALTSASGTVYLTGLRALVRLAVMQGALDRERGLRTAGFVSGYRGSPLSGLDLALWKAKMQLEATNVRFLPAINEDLAATAVMGTQKVEVDPQRTVDGVFAMWYGKGPGVDRAGDALKHGNAYGSSPHGGVLVVAGDDHGCVSSSMPHQSDLAFQAWSMPIVNPANIAEYLEFGLYGWALSRFSGAWVAFKAIAETVESASTVDLGLLQIRFDRPVDYAPPADGLHYRWPDLPSLAIEARLAAKLDAARAFARANGIDKLLLPAPHAKIGIVTCGKAHFDLLEVFRRLQLTLPELEAEGVRLYKVGQSYPIEPARMLAFAEGLQEILVIEEKAPVVEQQMKLLLYHAPATDRPAVLGKTDSRGNPLISALGELRPSRIMGVVAEWLARHDARLDRREHVADFTMPRLLSNEGDAVRRLPYFCSGCPHNTSTRLPEGSRALAGIGCHFMASWMDRETTGLIQMGGEGIDWVSQSLFTRTPHVFQNLGDGTYFHSGYLAIRQAIAAKATLTYKILYNDAVAMTGGQPVEGHLTVPEISRQVEAEGAVRVAVVSDEVDKYRGHESEFARGTTFHPRSELDRVQRELRDLAGVSILIYDQTCAAEKRRRRKKGEYPDPPRRLMINTAVCENCGDCTLQSNCLSVIPVDTEFGRKRMIDQSSCNKDYSCVNGFCPSFVSVLGGEVRKPVGHDFSKDDLAAAIALLPPAPEWDWTGPFDLLVTGVGGTGVVTLGALIAVAAHLEGKQASVLDFMGFAQKGGSVLAFVRIATRPEWLNQARIDTQQADALLACDLVVGAGADALGTVKHGRTQVIVNRHEIATASFMRDANADVHAAALLAKMRHAAGEEHVRSVDAQALALRFLGDTLGANVLLLGYAWQRGLVPVSLGAVERAIELNGVAVQMNRDAFALGRLAASNPAALDALAEEERKEGMPKPDDLEALLAHRKAHLAAWQDAQLGVRYEALVREVEAAERKVAGSGRPLGLTLAVARNYAKLLAYKDEYEVARLYTDGQFTRSLKTQFEGPYRLALHLAPPFLAKPGKDGAAPRKVTFGPWIFTALGLLAKFRFLRGRWLDPFAHSQERRLERQLARDYERTVRDLLPALEEDNRDLAIAIASVPDSVRGFGHVKMAHAGIAKAREQDLLARYFARDTADARTRLAAIGVVAR